VSAAAEAIVATAWFTPPHEEGHHWTVDLLEGYVVAIEADRDVVELPDLLWRVMSGSAQLMCVGVARNIEPLATVRMGWRIDSDVYALHVESVAAAVHSIVNDRRKH